MERCPSAEQLERWLHQHGAPGESQELARHVDDCPRCQQALDALAAGAAAATVAKRELPPTVDEAALNRLKEARPAPGLPDGARGPAPPAASGAPSRLEEEIRRLLLWRLRVLCPLLAVFLVALLALFLGVVMD